MVPDWVEGAADVFGTLLIAQVPYLDIGITGTCTWKSSGAGISEYVSIKSGAP